MKTKFYFGFILLFALALSAPLANAQTLIQFWDFNHTPPSGGGGGDSLGNVTNKLVACYTAPSIHPDSGHIIYSVPNAMFGNTAIHNGILDNGSPGAYNYDYSSNPTYFSSSDSAFGNNFVRTRNPSDSSEFLIYIPTTGYKNIMFDFAISASSSKGPNYGIFSYTDDGGHLWRNLTTVMDTFNISGTKRPDTLQLQNPTTAASNWYPCQINFSSDDSVNNNPNFIVRIRMAGVNSDHQTSGNSRWDNMAFLGTSTGTGVDEVNQNGGYTIFPNPAPSSGVVNIVSHYTGDKIVTLYDALGQVVCTTKNHDIETVLHTNSLMAGLYVVEINEIATGNKYTQKVVVE